MVFDVFERLDQIAQEPFAFAVSIAARPAGVITPVRIKASTRCLLSFDQSLVGRRRGNSRR